MLNGVKPIECVDGEDVENLIADLVDARVALKLADEAIDYDLGICTDHAGNCCVAWCAHCKRSEAAIVEKAKLSNAYREARGR